VIRSWSCGKPRSSVWTASPTQSTCALTTTSFVVIVPFAGACNGLYWILHYVSNAKGLGFEIDRTIFDLTKGNLMVASLDRQIELVHGDHTSLLDRYPLPRDHFVVGFREGEVRRVGGRGAHDGRHRRWHAEILR
jgi:hypothetical protein